MRKKKVLLVELNKQFPDIENKGYDKRRKEREEIVSNFNAGNPNEIKRGFKKNQVTKSAWKSKPNRRKLTPSL